MLPYERSCALRFLARFRPAHFACMKALPTMPLLSPYSGTLTPTMPPPSLARYYSRFIQHLVLFWSLTLLPLRPQRSRLAKNACLPKLPQMIMGDVIIGIDNNSIDSDTDLFKVLDQ
eukprot:4458578-Pleurochrysis_carterae.AAC.1